MPNETCLTWLPFLPHAASAAARTPLEMAKSELNEALPRLQPNMQVQCVETADTGDGYTLRREGENVILSGSGKGILYGAYRLMMDLYTGEKVPAQLSSRPRYALRMLNCWDNADGSVERGYAGRSLLFEGGRLSYSEERVRQLGRMLASVGINAVCINNVNVHENEHALIEESGLPETAHLADLWRPFGIRLILSVDYAHPLRHGLKTADPLDPDVRAWWKERADIIYRYIPDLAGFLVKADSENRPGPFTYGRDHAQGANMLAEALQPHGGVLIWRCFVYNCKQDWRDHTIDRPCAAYDHYAPLDGRFAENVILQVKNGPYDFQVREPVSPLFFAMPETNLALELQLAQEYTGQQIDLYAMPPMWKEIFSDLPPENIMSIAAVGNLGRDWNYTGHPFAAVNLFGYGQFAWGPETDPEGCIRRWARLTFSLPGDQTDTLCAMLLKSRSVNEKYTASLGLCWMVNPSMHYGPCPGGYEFSLWGTYHRANREAVGIDRTEKGTGYTAQYPEPLRSLYADPERCPELLLLFFHRLPYSFVMKDGRTLLQRLYDDHFEGYEEARRLSEQLSRLSLPSPHREEALARMEKQVSNAREWCDVVNTFFFRLTGIADAHGRRIYD